MSDLQAKKVTVPGIGSSSPDDPSPWELISLALGYPDGADVEEVLSKFCDDLRSDATEIAGKAPAIEVDDLLNQTLLALALWLQGRGGWHDDAAALRKLAMTIMRSKRSDILRKRWQTQRRSGPLNTAIPIVDKRSGGFRDGKFSLDVEDVLEKEPVLAELLRLMYVEGYTSSEAVQMLGLSQRSAERHLSTFKRYLRHQLEP